MRGSRGVPPRFVDLSSRMRGVVSFMPRPLYPRYPLNEEPRQLQAGPSGFRIPVGVKRFFSYKRPDRFWGGPSLLFNRYRRSFEGIKRPGRAEIKNEWSYTPGSPVCLRLVARDS